MFGEKDPYKNVIVFPTGKQFAISRRNTILIEKVKNFNDYIIAIEYMVKNFKSANQNKFIDNNKTES